MVFENLQAIWHMEGHGAYVWSAYGIATVVLLWLLIAPIRRHRALQRQIQGQLRRDERRQHAEHPVD